MKYVNEYYEKRFKLYGLSKELTPFTKYAMVRLAINADEYNQFHKLVTHFSKESLVSNLRISWLFVIGDFYIKNNNKAEGIKFYNLLSKKYPKSERIKNDLEKLK